MAPTATDEAHDSVNGANGHAVESSKLRREPLKSSGSIDHLHYVDVTPIIGREYPTAKIRDMLNADNAEQQLRDLAITSEMAPILAYEAIADASLQSVSEVLCSSVHRRMTSQWTSRNMSPTFLVS